MMQKESAKQHAISQTQTSSQLVKIFCFSLDCLSNCQRVRSKNFVHFTLAYYPCFSFSGSVEHFQIKWGLALCGGYNLTFTLGFIINSVFFSVLRLSIFPFSTDEWATKKCDIVCTQILQQTFEKIKKVWVLFLIRAFFVLHSPIMFRKACQI